MRHNGYVYETFGISKHFPVKLHESLLDAETVKYTLSRQKNIPPELPVNLLIIQHI